MLLTAKQSLQPFTAELPEFPVYLEHWPFITRGFTDAFSSSCKLCVSLLVVASCAVLEPVGWRWPYLLFLF